MPISATDLNKAYLAYFGRPADVSGKQFFATKELAEVIATFDASAESQALYGSDVSAKINAIYNNLFNRDAEPAGLVYWLGQVNSGKITPAAAAISILNGAQNDDLKSVTNKLAAADAFTNEINTTAEILGYSGLAAVNSARAFMKTVGAADASLTAAVAAAPAALVAAVSSTNNEAGASRVLTVNQDILTGTAGNDTFRGVAGVQVGNQDQTTLNSSDIIDGATGMDTLIVNMTGPAYNGGARIKNIETLQIGTNQAAAAFDYNVNAGANEITEVTKIVYDQINVGETLTVNNVIKTAGALPMVAWYNDSSNATAGVAAVNYRAAQVSGTTDAQAATDAQAVEFNNVTAGATGAQLNIDAGIETITLGTATGSSAITLNNSARTDTLANNVAADIISSGSLTKVELIGASTFGKAAGVVAATGLQDRVVASDMGITTATTASNLLSVGSRVTTVDASKLTGDSNVRFTAKNDNSDTNVTFTGGEGKDYVEFERGAVNADGGKGADTFAFVTLAAGITNSGFGSTDTLKGGEGADTVQVGLNGVGTYTLNTTEFNNKTGFETVDVRGLNNDITVSSEFVAAADVGKFTIRTDKMVQSAAGSADQTGGSGAEAASVSVINLTALNQNQGVAVVGGSGSERVVVNNASLNAATEIDGGTNGGVAGRYDTLTILNTTVADAGDLANVKGLESMILAETVTGASRFDITLTEAFLLANTAAANAVGTTIDDTVFRIGSADSSTGTALKAGDTVVVDISGLLNAGRTALSANLAGRGVDVNFAAGVTVNYVVDGAAATAGQIALVTKADAARADAGVSSAAGTGVAPVAPVVPGAVVTGNTFTLTANTVILNSTNANLGTNAAAGTFLSAAADTIVGGTFINGTSNWNITDTDATAGVNDVMSWTTTNSADAPIISGIETLNIQSFGGGANLNTISGNTTINVTGAGATFTNALADEAFAVTNGFTGTLDITTATDGQAVKVTTTGATLTLDGNDAVGANTGISNFKITNSGTSTIAVTGDASAAGNTDVTLDGSGAVTLTPNAAVNTITATNFTGTLTVTTAVVSTVTGGSGVDTITVGGNTADSIFGGAGNDVINATAATTAAASIRGGQGDDTISLGTAAVGNTAEIQFETTAAQNGVDAITGFAAGTALNKLDFRAFVSGRAIDDNTTAGTANTGATTITPYTKAGTGNGTADVVNNAVVALNGGATAMTTTEIAAEFAAGKNFAEAVGQRTVILEGNAGGATRGVNIYYVFDADSNGDIAATEVTLVGTLNAGTFLDLDTIQGNQIL